MGKIIKQYTTTPNSSLVVDSLDSTNASNSLSARQGNILYGYIQNLSAKIDNLTEEIDTKKLYINGQLALQDPNATTNIVDTSGVGIPLETNSLDELILLNGNYIKAIDTAGFHNSIFRGANLTGRYTYGQLSSRIADGSFSDLYIGDYINVIIDNVTYRMTIAGFDLYMKMGYENLTTHHVHMVLDWLDTQPMNDTTNTTAGGYAGTTMRTSVLNTWYTALNNVLGSGHIISYDNLLSETVVNGETTAADYYNTKLCLMTEANVYGTQMYCNIGTDFGFDVMQFPLFRLNPAEICRERKWFWLRNVVSSTQFACVSNRGIPTYQDAVNYMGVRPYFLFK